MNDNDGSNDPGNVINFARRTGQTGFNLTPTTTLPGPVIPPPPDPDTTPTITLPHTQRRSPLDALNALPDPGLTAPPVPYTPPVAPGMLPATFRAEPAPDMVGPRLGALSLAAILAVAVAALRGTHTVLSTWWENRQARQAETATLREARTKHALAMQGIRDKGTLQRAKTNNKIPSSALFGSKALSGRTSSGSGSGSGRGRSGGSGSSSGSGGSGRGPKNNRGGAHGPKQKKNGGLFSSGSGSGNSRSNGSGSGTGGGGKGKGGGHGLNNKTKNTPKSPHRTSQGAGTLLKKNRNSGGLGPGGKHTNGTGGGNGAPGHGTGKGNTRGGGRTTLPQAVKKTAQKAAARRLKRRRKNLNNPVLWGGGRPGRNNKQLPGGNGNGAGQGNGNGQTGNTKPVNLNKPQTTGRTTLAQALRKTAVKAARKRLKQRRRNPSTPPIWGAGKPRVNLKKKRRKPKRTGNTPGAGAAGHGRNGQQQATQPGPGAPGPNPGAHHGSPGGNRQRKSPFQNAGQAAQNAAGTTYTVTRDDHPGAQAKTWQPDAVTTGTPALPSTGPAALDAPPAKTFPRPGITRPKEARPMPPAPARNTRITKARNQAARTGRGVIQASHHMDPQHATEITLDDALDQYAAFKDKAFKTHDKCFKLAARARKLRDILAVFAVDLAVNHNLIGALFSRAMARMAESMDLVARMADEMQISSLEAAEMAEAASNDLDDAYRPYSTATKDAGLAFPSAPIHNQS